MPDSPLATHAAPSLPVEEYRCPGEPYVIDRAVHLGRLAAFYPACRECERRHETHTLSPQQIGQRSEVERRSHAGPRFSSESLAAISRNQMSAAVVRQLATALAIELWRRRENRPQSPVVLVATDGHWGTSELVFAVCEALQLAGCRAVDAGAATSPVVAMANRQIGADAAIWLGNASGEPHAIDAKLWGAGGMPWSSPGDLDGMRAIFATKIGRPKRRGGGLERLNFDERYLATFRPLFHALRPLKLVIDTTCEPLVRYLNQLMSQGACQVARLGHQAGLNTARDASKSFVAKRLAAIGRQVVADGAHFGLWIDGDGEACHLVDERGKRVASEKLLVLLARAVCRERSAATLVLERGSLAEIGAALSILNVVTVHSESKRQAMFAAMESSGAVLGGGPSGRFWFSGEPAAPDALLVVSLLLTLLSESDRPLTEVLDGP